MVRVVEDSTAVPDPFPHFLVRGMLPDDIYRQMLALLPDAALYAPFAYGRQSYNGVSTRDAFKFTTVSLQRLHGDQKSLWLGLRHALCSVELKNEVFANLRAGLALRFGIAEKNAQKIPGFARPELFRETAHYEIKPHPDTRRKLVTMQIALPADDSQEHLGTEFYRRSFDPRSLFREPRGFEIVKRPPFLPNCAYAFAVLNKWGLKSWHGRTTLSNVAGARNSILNIWYAQAADTKLDIYSLEQPARAA
jgi:hypothetical protein